jgi:CheY-like chemotaxis protein
MPGMAGFRVKEILSEDRSTSSIPFIYLTGQIGKSERFQIF